MLSGTGISLYDYMYSLHFKIWNPHLDLDIILYVSILLIKLINLEHREFIQSKIFAPALELQLFNTHICRTALENNIPTSELSIENPTDWHVFLWHRNPHIPTSKNIVHNAFGWYCYSSCGHMSTLPLTLFNHADHHHISMPINVQSMFPITSVKITFMSMTQHIWINGHAVNGQQTVKCGTQTIIIIIIISWVPFT